MADQIVVLMTGAGAVIAMIYGAIGIIAFAMLFIGFFLESNGIDKPYNNNWAAIGTCFLALFFWGPVLVIGFCVEMIDRVQVKT